MKLQFALFFAFYLQTAININSIFIIWANEFVPLNSLQSLSAVLWKRLVTNLMVGVQWLIYEAATLLMLPVFKYKDRVQKLTYF